MSDSESDIAFESADEGEESFRSTPKAVRNLNDEVDVERLNCSTQFDNIETEKAGKVQEKEITHCSPSQEVNVCNIDKCIKNLIGNRKTTDEDEKEFKILKNSNSGNVNNQLVANDADDQLESKYTEDVQNNEKELGVVEEKSNDDDSKNSEQLKFEKELSKCTKDSSNRKIQFDPAVKSVKEKPERVVLKFEKKLSEKSKSKSVPESAHKKKEPDVLNAPSNMAAEKKTTSSWGWGNWSSSLLSSAASSVSVFTSQVSEGLGTVLGTVESTLGAPPPEELAAALESKKKENIKEEIKTVDAQDQEQSSGLFDSVSSLSKVIENTGSKVLMTGLDTLELIGKTTFDILTEGDPGLRKKRAYFTNTTNLSEVLREAKEKAEASNSFTASEDNTGEVIHYSALFDDFQGIVHLEALEMLSRQNKTALQGLLISKAGDEMKLSKEIISAVQDICENLPPVDDTPGEESHHEFVSLIKDYSSKLELNLNTSKIEEVHKNIHEWLKTCQKEQDKGEFKDAKELHYEALKSLAQLTAHSMELFHKVAEMILYKSPDNIPALSYAEYLTDITSVLCFEVGIIATKFCQCLNTAADDSEDPDSVTPIITDVYLEASNSSTYIQDAFQLLVPILQVIAIKQSE